MEEYDYFECAFNCAEADTGLNYVLKHTPDILFIHLNEASPSLFAMVRDMHQYLTDLPIIIGFSNSKDNAYEALKNGFFDYWLQPFNEFDIRKSVLRLKKVITKENVSQTLCLQSYKDYHYLDTNDILYLKADNNTTEFYMKDGSINNAYKTLKTFENSLPDTFIRIHQSYIVNTNYVSRINFGKSICVIRFIKKPLPFSKTYRENLNDLKKSLSKNTLSSVN